MISHYGVLVGKLKSEFERGKHPHIYFELDTKESLYHTSMVAINILDYSGKDVMFCAIDDLKASFLPNLLKLDYGSYYLTPDESSGAIDYIRGGFISQMAFLKKTKESLEETLIDRMAPYAKRENDSKIYCVGSRFPRGIHDIHMNQGEEGEKDKSAGWNDGAIIIKDSNKSTVSGLFFYFQEQVWKK